MKDFAVIFISGMVVGISAFIILTEVTKYSCESPVTCNGVQYFQDSRFEIYGDNFVYSEAHRECRAVRDNYEWLTCMAEFSKTYGG